IVLSTFLVIKLLAISGFNLRNFVKRSQNVESDQKPYSLNIPIITYHYIEIVTDKNDFLRKNMAITPTELKREINELKSQGYEFVFIKEIPKLLHMKTPPTGKFAAITFDDGYRDFYTDAFPVIKETGVKATVFVITGFVNYQNYMTNEQIKEVSQSGLVEVGAHTMSHIDLRSITPAHADSEIVGSKDYLESKLGIKVESFSYPFGGFNNEITQMVKNASYTSAVSDISGTTQSLSNLYSLSRIRVGYFFKFE
ncbi:MAG: polysaccharide deacetylase family protein, partial [Patescibacteria group bacterium]